MRIYVAPAADAEWTELTDGTGPAVRVAASDLQHAQRVRARVKADDGDVAVVLDVTVAVARDFRSARLVLGTSDSDASVHYVGTVDGLAGLIADIGSAEVADGVTLIPASPRQDVHALGQLVLSRLAVRRQARAS
ncbi:MAG: hypothetical protein JST91_26650 [Actinobacteria bacterium]|nr:hypothetical protein [Actinomycetota bacterium]